MTGSLERPEDQSHKLVQELLNNSSPFLEESEIMRVSLVAGNKGTFVFADFRGEIPGFRSLEEKSICLGVITKDGDIFSVFTRISTKAGE